MSTITSPSPASPFLADLDVDLRLKAADLIARQVGIRLPPTRVPEGSSLWEVGEQAKRRLEQDFDALPSFTEAAAALRTRIAQEDPRDVPEVPIQHIRMSPERAGLYGKDKSAAHALGYTQAGLSHVSQFIKPPSVQQGFVQNLLAIQDPALRSQVFNYHAERAHGAGVKPVTLRTIREPRSGVRVIRAVTSDKHSLETGDDSVIVRALTDGSVAGSLAVAKARITRELDHSYMELIWPAMKRQLKVGDIINVGLIVRNSETKAGALVVNPYVLRVACFNFTTVRSSGGEDEVNVRHVGDLRTKLAEAFSNALRKVDPFVKRFADAYRTPLPGSKTRGEMLQAVKAAFPFLPEATINDTSKMWDADGSLSAGDTLAGLVNAMTRASQTQTMELALDTERVAGDLIARGFDLLN